MRSGATETTHHWWNMGGIGSWVAPVLPRGCPMMLVITGPAEAVTGQPRNPGGEPL